MLSMKVQFLDISHASNDRLLVDRMILTSIIANHYSHNKKDKSQYRYCKHFLSFTHMYEFSLRPKAGLHTCC
jgi:hypothetical protein